jgi:phage terminase large subunit-like protein
VTTATAGQTHGSQTSPDPGCEACGWVPQPGELWPTHGPVAVQWIEDNCICAEGDWYGKLMVLRDDQKAFLYEWYEYCPKCEQWHYNEGLRGAATGDGKTTFVAAIVVLEFAGPPQIRPPSPNIPIAAASFEQADLLFGAVATMCGGKDGKDKDSPLNGFFEVYDTEVKFADGQPGRVFRVAAVAGTNEGGLPTLFVCDELHEWGEAGGRRARVKTVIGKSTRKRRTPHGCGRVLSLSTAGFDKDASLLGDMCKLGERAAHRRAVAPRYLYRWYSAPEGLDYTREDHRQAAVRAASRAADTLWNVADRVNDWGTPDWPVHEWLRYYANRWVDVPEDSWLKDHPAAWSDCSGEWEASDAHPWVLAVDMALKHDSVAVARVEALPDGRIAVTCRIWRATDTEGRIPHDEVWRYIRDNARGLGFRGVVYDPRYFEVPARMLEDYGVLAIEFDQSPQQMTPACGLAFKRILEGTIVHDGDPVLASHVKQAAAVPQERGGFTLKKGKSKSHIDACIAMCMGLWILDTPAEPPPPKAWAARR